MSTRPERGAGGSLRWDAVVLAGGRGSRLGGISKGDLKIGGVRLIDRVLAATTSADRVVVVGDLEIPGSVERILEQPRFAGPAAAVAAGVEQLRTGPTAPWVGLFACDLPAAAEAVGALLPHVSEAATDGVVFVDADGRTQWLLGVYRHEALAAAIEALGDPAGKPLRALLGDLRLTLISGSPAQTGDIDTWEDVARWR